MHHKLIAMVANTVWGGLYLVSQERSARIESREGIVWRVTLHAADGPVHKLFIADGGVYVACRCCVTELGTPYTVQLSDGSGNVLSGGLYDYDDSAMVQIFRDGDIDTVHERDGSGGWRVTMRGGFAV